MIFLPEIVFTGIHWDEKVSSLFLNIAVILAIFHLFSKEAVLTDSQMVLPGGGGGGGVLPFLNLINKSTILAIGPLQFISPA